MPFDTHVFISDAHLGAFSEKRNQEIEEDLIALIQYCKEQEYALYVLGDLFDYWMEYPHKDFVPDLGHEVLTAFEEYNQSVMPALYITGNHDNWSYGHFEQRGFDVEHDFRVLDIGEKQFLLMHGDGTASPEVHFPRALFHRLLRSKTFVSLYQKLFPPAMGLNIMKLFSSLTRKSNHENPDVLEKQAEKIFQNHRLDFILSGHDHTPRKVGFSEGTYMNLGTFFDHRSVAVYNNEGLELVVWEASTQNFLPFGSTK